MAEDRLETWKILFRRALELIDSVAASGHRLEEWSFGGGTVLMLRHRHRFSKDIDIFVNDPQYLGYLSPRLNSLAESLTNHYDELGNSTKLYFPEGEIDFVASGALSKNPTITESIFDRPVQVETSTEIIAKKIWHRGEEFAARDIFDLAMVAEKESDALTEIKSVLRDRRDVVLERIQTRDTALREDFAELAVLEYKRSYDDCVEIVRKCLDESRE